MVYEPHNMLLGMWIMSRGIKIEKKIARDSVKMRLLLQANIWRGHVGLYRNEKELRQYL